MDARANNGIAVAALSLTLLGCGEPEPRPQLRIYLDTDAPITGQLAGRPELSRAAAVDTVVIHVTNLAGELVNARHVVAPNIADWPVSFGIAAPEGSEGTNVVVRAQVFHAAFTAEELSPAGVPQPLANLAIDRLFAVALPNDGIVSARVELALECMGVAADIDDRRTCLDLETHDGSIEQAVQPLDGEPPPSSAGSSWMATEVPCEGPARAGAKCIRGGFSLLGERSMAGVTSHLDMTSPRVEPVPLEPVYLSPFWLDETEFTVGRFNELIRAGHELSASGNSEHCTWRDVSDTSAASFPVNCLGAATAERACELSDGALPSEAQWEHAARGRGEQRLYPWGVDNVTCCATSIARAGVFLATQCEEHGSGPQPVGSHPIDDDCAGLGDVSRDGVLDMAGSMTELLRDGFHTYGEGCWSAAGVATDPVCEDIFAPVSIRGGNWSGGTSLAALPLRSNLLRTVSSPQLGFRCAYEDAP